MLCPYCLKEFSGTKCQTQGCPEIPIAYLEAQKGLFPRAPAMFSAVGFSGHGKTVYLAALFQVMGRNLVNVWPDFYRQGLETEAVRTVMDNLARLEKGVLPDPTPRNFPRPSLHKLVDMPHFKTRTWLVYDPPGEAFESDADIERFAHFVGNSRAVVFLISVPDLNEPKGQDMYRLLELYVLGMKRLHADTTKQHLVVTFTKSDRIAEQLERYPIAHRHLLDGDYSVMSDPKQYLKRIADVSKDLENFVRRELDGEAFLRFARNSFKSVALCAVSALGSAPEDGKLQTKINPHCVADPLIWVLDRT